MKTLKALFMVCALSILVTPALVNGENPNRISDDVAPSTRTDITLRGYFKDTARNRIRTFAVAPGTAAFTVQNHAYQLQQTEGRLTEAYYYPEGSAIPGDELTYAKNLREVHFLLYDTEGLSSWRYVYRQDYRDRNRDKAIFIDCSRDKKSDYCRDNHIID